MANKKLTDFTQQTILDYSTRLYGVPYSGVGAFTDTQVPITVLFDTTTFTGVTTVASLAAGTAQVGGVDIVTVSGSQVLTNKTLTSPAINTPVVVGGTINNSVIGNITPSASSFTTITSTGLANFNSAQVAGIDIVTLSGSQILTNKTLTAPTINTPAISAGTANNIVIGGVTPAAGSFTTISATGTITPSQTNGIVGTTTNNNANAGSIGEFVTSSAGPTALTTGVTVNLTSISLTAGDWDISGTISTAPAGTTVQTNMVVGISTVSVTFGAIGSATQLPFSAPAGVNVVVPTPNFRLSLSTTTTVFLIAQVVFSVSTLSANGQIRARRVR